jgi:hypothetical protein
MEVKMLPCVYLVEEQSRKRDDQDQQAKAGVWHYLRNKESKEATVGVYQEIWAGE